MKRLLNLLGLLLTLAALWYVGQQIMATGALESLKTQGLDPRLMLAAIAVGLLGNCCLALGWARLLGALTQAPLRIYDLFNIHAISQIGKYLPGNVFHLVGRYGLTRKLGLPHAPIALSTLIEPLLMVTIAGLCALPFVLRWLSGALESWFMPALLLLAGLGIAGLVLARLLYQRSEKVRSGISPVLEALLSARSFGRLAQAVLLYALYSICVAVNLAIFLDPAPIGYVLFFSASVFAWILGYVTIGSPGGLGIREVAFMFAIGNMMDQGDVAAALALSRLSLILSDILFFALGVAGRKLSPPPVS